MLSKLWEMIFGAPTGSSWIDLDERMRAKLKFSGVISFIVLVVIVLLSLYYYIQLPPLKALVDKLIGDIATSIKTREEIPKWIITVGTFFFSIMLIVTSVFFWALIDLGKVHYKLDRLTFHIIGFVQQHILLMTREALGCPDSTECRTKALAADLTGRRRFMNDFFYHFANMDAVGAHNQKDKRRQVFLEWTKYYMFNYASIICLLILLWITFLVVIKASSVRWLGLIPGVSFVVVVCFWVQRGLAFKRSLLELAADQIRAFDRFARGDFITQARSVIGSCGEGRCPL